MASEATVFVYNAGGMLVAEYGQKSDGLGGVKYIQQDWQGSVRTVTNANGFVVARTDHQAFGGEIGYGTGLRSIDQGYNVQPATTQGYGLTERDNATGLDHTWFRKNENSSGRWTSPDPYNGSMELGNPQSFNRYGYVGNDPINFIDPSGLMRVCWFTSWTECGEGVVIDDGESSTGNVSAGNSSGGCSLETGWRCIDIGGGGGLNPVIVNDPGNSVGGETCPPGPLGIVDPKCILRQTRDQAFQREECLKGAKERADAAKAELIRVYPYDAKWGLKLGIAAGTSGGVSGKAAAASGLGAVFFFLLGAIGGGTVYAQERIVDRVSGSFAIASEWEKAVRNCGLTGSKFVPRHLKYIL